MDAVVDAAMGAWGFLKEVICCSPVGNPHPWMNNSIHGWGTLADRWIYLSGANAAIHGRAL